MTEFSEHFYIIGHRGAAGERFENSLEGFEHALTLDIDMIEIDIREHSSELWVFHDRDLERLTGAAGNFEDQPDPSRIRLLNGEPIPTLQQAVQYGPTRRATRVWAHLERRQKLPKIVSHLNSRISVHAVAVHFEASVGATNRTRGSV